MPTTLRNTDILFNNGTTQGTAAVFFTTTDVLIAVASGGTEGIGSYALARNIGSLNLTVGNLIAGASLQYATAGGGDGPNIGVGTWRCHGQALGNLSANNPFAVSVFQRIS